MRDLMEGISDVITFDVGDSWHGLERCFADCGIPARAAAFDPPEIAAIAVKNPRPDEDLVLERILEGTQSDSTSWPT